MTTVTWTNINGGDWDIASNWSSSPSLPGASDTVAFTLPGTYNITTGFGDPSVVVAALLIDSPHVAVSGFINAGSIDLTSGYFGGPIGNWYQVLQSHGTVTGSGGTLGWAGLIDATLSGMLVLDDVQVSGGLTILPQSGGAPSVISGTIDIGDAETLDNVVMTNPTFAFDAVAGPGTPSLTFGSHATIIYSGTSPVLYPIFYAGNQGTILVEAGSDLSIPSAISNQGTMVALTGGTISLTGTVSATGFAGLGTQGGQIDVTTFQNAGGTLLFGASGFTTAGGTVISQIDTILGGTVISSGGTLTSGFANVPVVLDGVTWDGPLNLIGSDVLLTGNAQVNGIIAGAGQVELNNGILSTSSLDLLNNITVAATGNFDKILFQDFTQAGTLGGQSDVEVSGVTDLQITANNGTLVSQGTIGVHGANDAVALSASTWINSGQVTIAASSADLPFGGTLDNTGTFFVSDGGQLELNTIEALGSIVLSGSSSVLLLAGTETTGTVLAGVSANGGVLRIQGLLDNTNETLLVGGSGQIGTLVLGQGLGIYEPTNAVTVLGGTIVDTGTLVSLDGTLDNVDLQGNATIASSLSFRDGFNVHAAGGGIGTIDLGTNGQLVMLDQETIDSVVVTGAGSIISQSTVTFGPSFGVRLTGVVDVSAPVVVNDAPLTLSGGNEFRATTSQFINNASILVTGANTELMLDTTSVSTGGQIDVTGGAILDIYSPPATMLFSSVSNPVVTTFNHITLDSISTLILSGDYVPAQLTAFDDLGGTVDINGILDNTGNTLDLTAGSANAHLGFGEVEGGTVLATGYAGTINWLPNVTWIGSLAVSAGNVLSIDNSTTLVSTDDGPAEVDVTNSNAEFAFYGSIIADTLIRAGNAVGTDKVESSGTVTIASTATLLVDVANAGSVGIEGSFVNQGLIDQTTGTVQVDDPSPAASFNTGTIAVISGGLDSGGVITTTPITGTFAPILPPPISIDNQGTIRANSAGSFFTFGSFVGSSVSLSNEGLIQVGNGDDMIVKTPLVTNTGSIDVTTGGTLDFAAGINGDLGTITLDSGMLRFDATGTVATTATIVNFNTNDLIIVSGATSETFSSLVLNGGTQEAIVATIATFSNGLTLSFPGNVNLAAPSPGELTVACFASGTNLATSAGDRPVETLSPGDIIRLANGQTAPITWIGHRRIDCTCHPKPSRIWPIQIAPHAFGPYAPHNPLTLSPDHAIFQDGVLIPVHCLVNGTTVRQIPVDTIEYWHVELPSHDIVLAEGLTVESFLDTNGKADFAGGSITTLHPEFTAWQWETKACAPLILRGLQLEAVRARLSRIAAEAQNTPCPTPHSPSTKACSGGSAAMPVPRGKHTSGTTSSAA
jgi:hypothetical protein